MTVSYMEVLDPPRPTVEPPAITDEDLHDWMGGTGDDEGECHLALDDNSSKALCGFERKEGVAPCDGDWKGETVCQKCHKIVCPECIAIAKKILQDAADQL